MLIVVLFLATSIKIVQEYERGVIFRLGRCVGAKGPGVFFVIPVIDKITKINLQIIAAEGELQASQKLGEAATVMATSPGALQLRQLQTMVEISAEKNSTIIFPIPIELLEAFQAVSKAIGQPR